MKKLALALAITAAASSANAVVSVVTGTLDTGSSGSAFSNGGAIAPQTGVVDIDYTASIDVDIINNVAVINSATIVLNGTYEALNPPSASWSNNTWAFDNASYDLTAGGSITSSFPPVIVSEFLFNGGVGATVGTNAGPGVAPTSGSLTCTSGYCSITSLLNSVTLGFTTDLLNGALVTEDYASIAFGTANTTYVASASAVPVPAAAWLFGSALVGLAGVGRNRKAS